MKYNKNQFLLDNLVCLRLESVNNQVLTFSVPKRLKETCLNEYKKIIRKYNRINKKMEIDNLQRRLIKIDKETLKDSKDEEIPKSFNLSFISHLTDHIINTASELKKDKKNGKIGIKIINNSAYVATRCKFNCNYNDNNYYNFFGVYNSILLDRRICPIIENKDDLIKINNDASLVILTNKSEIYKIDG
jgi:hypothetical protein